MEKGEISVDSAKFGAILSAESIAISLAAKPVRWSLSVRPESRTVGVTWNPDLRLYRTMRWVTEIPRTTYALLKQSFTWLFDSVIEHQ